MLDSETLTKLYDSWIDLHQNESFQLKLTETDIQIIKQFLYRMENSNNNQTDDINDTDADTNCGGILTDIASVYANDYHPYCAMIVCVFGTIANILNIIVLTRKDMVYAPINRILTALAVADVLLMIEYIPYAYYYYLILREKRDFPYPGAVYMLVHAHVTQVLHTISICLTLTLAIWRYLAIGYPEKTHILCSERRCTLAIFLSYIIPMVLCIPLYIQFTISSQNILENQVIYTLYHIDLSDLFRKDNNLLKANFWLYAVLIKLLPCCILTVISVWLIRTLFKAKKRKQVLREYDAYPLTANGKDARKKPTKAERRADRTTKMLVAVLVLFLVTEFPQGIFAFLIGIKGKNLFTKCYQQYGEFMDILALINGAINFILYCCMNRMFRATFGQLFKHRILAKWAAPPPSEIHTTTVGNGTNTTEL